MSDLIPAVCFVEDVARILRTSRRTIDRLRRHGCFPVKELPSLDKRPRWAGADVEKFLTSASAPSKLNTRQLPNFPPNREIKEGDPPQRRRRWSA